MNEWRYGLKLSAKEKVKAPQLQNSYHQWVKSQSLIIAKVSHDINLEITRKRKRKMETILSVNPQEFSSFLTFGNLTDPSCTWETVTVLSDCSRFQGITPPSSSKTTKGDNEEHLFVDCQLLQEGPVPSHPTQRVWGLPQSKQLTGITKRFA